MNVRDERGFTLVELMVSTFIMLAVTAAVFGLVNPAQGTYRAQPEVSDMQQRLRVAANALQQDLMMAGAGTYLGGSGGSLLNVLAPVLPYRIGTVQSDPASGVYYRNDAITIMYVPQTASQCTIRDDMPQTSSEVKVSAQPGCPAGNDLCGFEEGMRVIIVDDTGAYDPFTITNVQESALHLQHNQDNFSKAYTTADRARIAAIAMHTYYLKTDVATSTFQLRHYDGFQRDEPLVDNVVALEFEYLGDPRAPVMLRPAGDKNGPWTSYGPKPPALGIDREGDSWPEGENCLFTIDDASGLQVSRIPDLAATEALVPLTEAMLTDGPWCPQEAATQRFDADLLRVRTVRVRLRVQVASATLRGPAGVLFSRGGYSKGGTTWVPDQEVHFDISPRNMNFGR